MTTQRSLTLGLLANFLGTVLEREELAHALRAVLLPESEILANVVPPRAYGIDIV